MAYEATDRTLCVCPSRAVTIGRRGATPLGMRVVVTRFAYSSRSAFTMTTNDHSSTRDDGTDATGYTADRLADTIDVARTDVSPGVLFGILADTRPRYVLYYLMDHGDTGRIEDLVIAIATRENETTAELVTTEMKERVRKPVPRGTSETDGSRVRRIRRRGRNRHANEPDRRIDPVLGDRSATRTGRGAVIPQRTRCGPIRRRDGAISDRPGRDRTRTDR